ncbi:MAG: MFS transporter [Microbacteriaceae bacterium]|nr:MFS transporter [Microbacteriaceae bacterium]
MRGTPTCVAALRGAARARRAAGHRGRSCGESRVDHRRRGRAVDERERERLRRQPSARAITAALSLGGLTASFMQTIIVPIQGELPELLDAPRTDTAWVVTITLLTAAVATPIAGRLGDMFGKRRIALATLAVMTLGSVIAATVPGIAGLIVGRGLQGVGMGVLPLGISIMRDTLPERRLPGGIALMSATMGIGGAIGLPLSAIVAEHLDWRLLFWIAGALGAICFAFILGAVPVSVLRTPGRFDWVGAIGLAAGVVGVLLALSRGNEWGWASPATLGLGGGGVAVLLAWGWYELRDRNPLVDLRIAVRRPVLLTNLSSMLLSFGMFSFNIIIPQYIELPAESGVGLGQTLFVASLAMLPFGVMMLVLAPVAGRLIGIVGPKALLVAGGIVVAIAYLVVIVDFSSVWPAIVSSFIGGVGISVAFAAMPTLIMRSVPATETAAANGLNSLMRSIGTTLAAAVGGAILATLTHAFAGAELPTRGAFQLTFLIALGASLLSAAIAAFIPRHAPHAPGERAALPD